MSHDLLCLSVQVYSNPHKDSQWQSPLNRIKHPELQSSGGCGSNGHLGLPVISTDTENCASQVKPSNLNPKMVDWLTTLTQHRCPASFIASVTCKALTAYTTCSQQSDNLSLWRVHAALEIYLALVTGAPSPARPLAQELTDTRSCLGLCGATELGHFTASCVALDA